MKRIDASEAGIFGISWSPDSEWIAYVRNDEEVCIANANTGEIRIIGPGSNPFITRDKSVVFERKDEIVEGTSEGIRSLIGANDLVKSTPKRLLGVSPDNKYFLFVAANIYDKKSQQQNSYPYRHFIGIGGFHGKKAQITDHQWYGGTACWFPNSELFTHYEFDSTGGARIHIVDTKGMELGSAFGLNPSVSPDGTRVACKPKSGGNVVVYTNKGNWAEEEILTSVHKLPESKGRLSGNSPSWLDNRFLLIDENDKLWRVDTRKDDVEEFKKIPVPAIRGSHTMAISPSRQLCAIEVEKDGVFELLVGSTV